MAAELSDAPPDLFVEEDDDPAIHSVTNHRPAIYLTTGLLQCLEPAELKAAIAHEIAHIRRSRRPLQSRSGRRRPPRVVPARTSGLRSGRSFALQSTLPQREASVQGQPATRPAG